MAPLVFIIVNAAALEKPLSHTMREFGSQRIRDSGNKRERRSIFGVSAAPMSPRVNANHPNS
jgi:hypothetical protein